MEIQEINRLVSDLEQIAKTFQGNNLVNTHKRKLVDLYIVSSVLYEEHNISIISDSDWDRLALYLSNLKDKLLQDKVITKKEWDMIDKDTGMQVHRTNLFHKLFVDIIHQESL